MREAGGRFKMTNRARKSQEQAKATYTSKSHPNQNSRMGGISRAAMAMAICFLPAVICGAPDHRVGDIRDVPGFEHSAEIQSLGRFAVDEFNKQQNTSLSFKKVARARQQVVAGILYYLTIEVADGDQTKDYEAKLLLIRLSSKNIQRLEEFKPVEQRDAFYAPVKEGFGDSGWHVVPTQDPVVQEAAQNAVKIIQQRSNSLTSYELQQIVSAKTEESKGLKKFNILLEVKWGTKVSQYQVEMQRSVDGKWTLNHVQQD